jgi:hypothetical protein
LRILVNIIILLLYLIEPGILYAGDWHLLDADYLGLEYREHRNYRDDYFPEYTTIEGECRGITKLEEDSKECFKYGANVLFNLNLITIPGITNIFWRNDVNMDATNKQVRHVGWNWEAGFPVGDKIELFHHHYSRHILDSDPQVNRGFPLRDEYVVKFNLYRRDK